MFCVYLTVYSGNLLPCFYIGSTSLEKINNGYKGSVTSKKYAYIFRKELSNNPHLFKTHIICITSTRQHALEKENSFQRRLNVVQSPLYINESYASQNGFFGMNNSKEFNGFFGKKHSEESKAKMRKKKSEETKAKMRKKKSDAHRRNMSLNNAMNSVEVRNKVRNSKIGKKRLYKDGKFKMALPGSESWNKLISLGYTH